jgi:hypothetical protein
MKPFPDILRGVLLAAAAAVAVTAFAAHDQDG